MKKTLTALLTACLFVSLTQFCVEAKQKAKTAPKTKQQQQIELKVEKPQNIKDLEQTTQAEPKKLTEEKQQAQLAQQEAQQKVSSANDKKNKKDKKNKEIKKSEKVSINAEPGFMKEKVFYLKQCDNIKIAAEIYVPKEFDKNKEYPAIIVVHPAGGVKEQTAGLYAQKLAEKGFVTLAYDAAYQGESGGEPRYVEDPASRVEDVRSAVDYLTTLPFVDKDNIGVLGICAGGGYAFNAAETEMRIKAVATVSAFDLGRARRQGLGDSIPEDQQKQKLQTVADQRTREVNGKAYKYVEYVPDSKREIPANASAMYKEGYEYYKTSRGAHPRAVNKYLFTSLDKQMAFTAFDRPESISPRAVLFIVGGNAETAYFSKEAYDKAKAPKEYFVIPNASHVALYDQTEYVAPAVDKLAEFYSKYLSSHKEWVY